ncbi:MAG: hypothetical protein KGV46_01815 [Pasteurella sp.]|nr:hypothetical protein [Pasteurella sp.]
MEKLLLMIQNPNSLEKGTLPLHIFDVEGGTVGSSSLASWYIDNYKQSIASIVFTIEHRDGEYCLKAKSDGVYVNNSHNPLYINQPIRLKTGDVIKVDDYVMYAKISAVDDEDKLTYESSLLDILEIEDALLLHDDEQSNIKIKSHKIDDASLLTMEENITTSDPLELLLDTDDKIRDDEASLFYDQLGIIPKDNLNESLQIPASYDIARTNIGTVLSFLPRDENQPPKMVVREKVVNKKMKKVINEEQEIILDPLVLLNNKIKEE